MLEQIANELMSRADALGMDALFEECGAIYDGKFRTQPEPASSVLDGEWGVWVEEFESRYGIALTPETLVCCIVNYKGEEEDSPAPFSVVEHLQVFHGKYDYL